MGNRIMEYLNNPDEKERTDSWMAMFELSNEGQQFNQAKMGGIPEDNAMIGRMAGAALKTVKRCGFKGIVH